MKTQSYLSPRRPNIQLQPAAGTLIAWACPETGGVFLAPQSVYHLMQRVLDMDFGTLKELPDYPAGRGGAQLLCSNCNAPMNTVMVRQVPVDYCRACGSLWFDPGELYALTGGRFGTKAGTPIPLKQSSIPAPASPIAARGVGPAPSLEQQGIKTSTTRKGWTAKEPEPIVAGLEMLLESEPIIRIDQDYTTAEMMVGWEAANRYHACTLEGYPLAHILERSEGAGGIARRIFMGSRRALEIEVVDRSYKQALMDIKRPFAWLWSDMELFTPTGRKLGSVHRKFSVLYKVFELHDHTGRLFATVKSPLWRFWTFPIIDSSGVERARISKRWSGFMKEMYTTADIFELDFGDTPWTLSQRCTIFAAAISIDFDFFENNQRGVAGLLPG